MKDKIEAAEMEKRRLQDEMEELQRQVALCQLCGTICTEESHAKKLREVQSNKRKRDGLLSMLGKRGRQSSLRSFFNKESRKNEAGFDRPNLIQTTISFVATQTIKQASQQSDGESDFSAYNRMALAEYNKERERD